MQKIENIELSPVEATSYWWVNLIKKRVKEIVIEGARYQSEAKFTEIFNNYTEIDWRNLYLQLVQYISEDVDNYVAKGNLGEEDVFSQDTAKNGHDRINEEISKIVNKRLPNIRLVSDNVKDSVIYTTKSFASVWYKSSGVIKLPTKYEPDYVLTGNDDELNFYNLLISTIVILKQENSGFNSIPLLRKEFCKEYIRLSNFKAKLENVIEVFNHAFDKANDEGLITGRSYKETYFPNLYEIDFVGLDSYMDLAKHYANVILQKVKDREEASYCKKLKRNSEK